MDWLVTFNSEYLKDVREKHGVMLSLSWLPHDFFSSLSVERSIFLSKLLSFQFCGSLDVFLFLFVGIFDIGYIVFGLYVLSRHTDFFLEYATGVKHVPQSEHSISIES